ncbi:MAG: ATP-grasp domain-containing protein [Actinomycetota bacterium]|nr:ATP-grasp domain-containing protein [Actinomycetota bacterium]
MGPKKVLILGVTHPQIDAILYCKKMGYEVHGLSYHNEDMGIPYLDFFEKINIVDKGRVLDYAARNNIDLIYSTGSDIALPTVDYVSRRLNLPRDITHEQIMLLTDKSNFRDFALKNGLSPVKFKVLKDPGDLNDWYYFPAIIKPVDSQGQRGVRKVNNREEIEKYFPSALKESLGKKIIIEEFLEGREVNVLIYMFKGKARYGFVIDRMLVEETIPGGYSAGMPVGVVKRHIIPSFIPEGDQKKIIMSVVKFIEISGIRYGPVYIQGKYLDGNFKLIEVSPRLDGGHIWKIIKYKYGIDLMKICFDRLLGEISSDNDFPLVSEADDKRYQIVFSHQKPDELFKVPADFNKDKCLEYSFYYKNGEKVNISNGRFEKTGYWITKI